MGSISAWAASVLMVASLFGPGAGAAGAAETASCAGAQASLAEGHLDQAKSQYLDVLNADPSSRCATAGLIQVSKSEHSEKRLCAQGDRLKEAGKTNEAEARYAKALGENVDSVCAKEGLKPAESDDGFWNGVGDVVDYAPKVPKALGAIFGILLAAFAVLGLARAVWVRWRRASLVVKPFADGAAEPKVGAGVAALLEQKLIALRRREPVGDGYDLDFVVADVELLATEEKLGDAIGTMSEVSQLQLVIALLELVDRLIPTRRLSVGGELLPAGDHGPGLALALYKRNGVRARGALWQGQIDDLIAPPTAAVRREVPNSQSPSSYYQLATPASWWVQYEAARALYPEVGRLTSSARSFSLLGTGLACQREGKLFEAAEAYARALRFDPENAGALMNLANVLARIAGRYLEAIILLVQAREVLEMRHQHS